LIGALHPSLPLDTCVWLFYGLAFITVTSAPSIFVRAPPTYGAPDMGHFTHIHQFNFIKTGIWTLKSAMKVRLQVLIGPVVKKPWWLVTQAICAHMSQVDWWEKCSSTLMCVNEAIWLLLYFELTCVSWARIWWVRLIVVLYAWYVWLITPLSSVCKNPMIGICPQLVRRL
jgi:hypothetical protein